MTRNIGSSAPASDGEFLSSYVQNEHSQPAVRRRNLRGLVALGVLFVTTVAGYGVAFVVFDLVYKGGSFGIL